ncbi:MAG: TIM-barrel domain-containing protein [Lacunisphaera sp.]
MKPNILTLLPLLATLAFASSTTVERQADGILVNHDGALTKIEVRADDIIRVASSPNPAFSHHASLMTVKPEGPPTAWTMTTGDKAVVLHTAKLQVSVDVASGVISFLDLNGKPILAEAANGRVLESAEVQGEKTFHIRQSWTSDPGEALYGLGENQLGLLNLKGYDLDLWQHNGTVAVPFFVSSHGYGILWDNNSYSRFGDLRKTEQIPAAQLFDAKGEPGALTASYYAGADFKNLVDQRRETKIDIALPDEPQPYNKRINPALPAEGTCSVRWEGFVEPATSGVHTFETFSNCGIKLWIDDKLVMNHWHQGWLPWFEVARVPLETGHRYKLKLEWSRDGRMPTMRLHWKTPTTETGTSLWSQVGDGIDYYFVYGPKLDAVIAGYRHLTGTAPIMPVWAFGLWQSRERYETARQSLDVVKGFRRRGIPFDNIVQDWRYWPEGKWGSHEFDPKRFPDPTGWIKSIHEEHAHLMLSVWGKFNPGTKNFDEMHKRGFLYERNLKEGTRDWLDQPYTFYDAFNPDARKLLWSQMDHALFRRGVDAWWMDATEPDLRPTPTLDGQRDYVNPTALGPGAKVLNAYPLLNSAAIYEGQRSVAPDQRVFILTRSGFAGQQRYAAATWSGDDSSTWTAMRKQIPAGLGFSISGLPYWTMDSGGFSVPDRFGATDAPPITPAALEEWRELNARWFQFATFIPLLRVHGQFPYREMWELGGESSPAYQTELKFDRLRYLLLPYVYSLAGQITHEGGTLMRPLVMDFANDVKARDLSDSYLFGPALLVNPVTTYQARTRAVYLPGTGGWYDFWTGAESKGGQTIDAAAPFDSMPLYVRAGSIIPFGPELQYTQEKPADPILLRVYAGEDGKFDLYEDDGVTYGYERGAFSTIPIHWNEAKHTLTIGKRTGSFPGMLTERTFNIILVDGQKPVGFSFTPKPDETIRYHGDAIEVPLK